VVADDVVTGGGEPGERRRGSAWFARVGGAVVVIGLVAAALSTHHSAHDQTVDPIPSAPASPSPVSVDNPDGFTGATFTGAIGEQLVSVGPPRTILDAATGHVLGADAAVNLIDLDRCQVVPLRGPTPIVTSPSTQLVAVNGGTVIAPCDGCGAGEVYALPADSSTAIALGQHDSAAPAADGNVLLIDARNQLLTAGDSPRPYRAIAHEVDVTGKTIGTSVAAPSGEHVIRGVNGGFLLTGTSGSEVMSLAGTVTASFPGTVYAADSSTVVWARSCDQAFCAMLWTDLATMTTTTGPAFPAGSFAVPDAAFSSDGRTLAIVAWQGDADITGKPQTQQIFFVRGPHAVPTAIDGTELRGNLALSLAWSPDGKYVFLATSPQAAELSAPRTLAVIPAAGSGAERFALPEFDGDSIVVR